MIFLINILLRHPGLISVLLKDLFIHKQEGLANLQYFSKAMAKI
jgi:hypothetical protein